ncbi:MAG: sigma-70 family RNA polymerase sigma factor [Planctomycetota bacterium]
MNEDGEDTAGEDFGGHEAPSLEGLMAHSAWVRALARRLVQDESRADDIVQETWLAALEHPPQPGWGLRSWLGAVVRNTVYLARRSQRRRERRERLAPIPAPPTSPEEAVEQVAAHRLVVEAVLRLPEPYRSTVILRFFQDATPQQISEQTGIPAATVRTHLHRGIALLRSDFKAKHGSAWCTTLFPLTGTPGSGTGPLPLAGIPVESAVSYARVMIAILLATVATTIVLVWPRGGDRTSSQVTAAPTLPEVTALVDSSQSPTVRDQTIATTAGEVPEVPSEPREQARAPPHEPRPPTEPTAGGVSAEQTAPAPSHLDIAYPPDQDVLLIRDKTESIVAWLPAEPVERLWSPSRLTYGPEEGPPETELQDDDVRLARREVRTMTQGQTCGGIPRGMVEVPAGQVVLGIPAEKALEFRPPDAGGLGSRLLAGCTPGTRADVSAFYVGTHEITNLQYKTYLQATKRRPSPFLIQTSWNYQHKKTGEIVQESYELGRDHEPIVAITLAEAQDGARWMNMRLPTEEEWTRAARGDDDPLYVWGNEWDATKCSNSRTAKGRLHDVGSYRGDVSWCGVYDLMGNVSELTTSHYDPLPGFKPLRLDSYSLLSPTFSPHHVVAKGGNASGTPYTNSTFFRNPVGMTDAYALVGFRCVKDPAPGRDALAAAVEWDLGLLSEVREKRWAWDDIGAQEILVYDEHRPTLVVDSAVLAFAHTERTPFSPPQVRSRAVERPLLVALFTTTKPVLEPLLPPGSYAVYYKASGTAGDPLPAGAPTPVPAPAGQSSRDVAAYEFSLETAPLTALTFSLRLCFERGAFEIMAP